MTTTPVAENTAKPADPAEVEEVLLILDSLTSTLALLRAALKAPWITEELALPIFAYIYSLAADECDECGAERE